MFLFPDIEITNYSNSLKKLTSRKPKIFRNFAPAKAKWQEF